MNETILAIGTKVKDKFSRTTGVIASAPFNITGEAYPMYALALDKPFWSEGRNDFISVLIINSTCVVPL